MRDENPFLVSYSGRYPDLPEFERPWQSAIQVGQGDMRVSGGDGTPLQTEGVSRCLVMLLRARVSLVSVLAHVEPLIGSVEWYTYREILSDLKKREEMQAILIRGTLCASTQEATQFLQYIGIPLQRVIHHEAADQPWALVYQPQDDIIQVDQRKGQLLIYLGFSRNRGPL